MVGGGTEDGGRQKSIFSGNSKVRLVSKPATVQQSSSSTSSEEEFSQNPIKNRRWQMKNDKELIDFNVKQAKVAHS